MNIWQIDPANLTPYYNLALCQALADTGQSVRYVTSKFTYDDQLKYPETFRTDFNYFEALDRYPLLHAPRVRQGSRALLYPFGHWRLLRELKHSRPDIVHIQWCRLPVFDRWLVSAVHNLGIPVVHTVHDVEPLFSQGLFTGQLQNVYAQVDALLVHTEDSQKRFLQALTEFNPALVHVIPHMIEDKIAPDNASKELARRLLGITPNAPVILFFGTIKHYKGVDILAQAIPTVKADNPDVQFWIVGRPETEQDARILAALSQLPGVHVRSGFVPSDRVWQYYLAADVVVFPYRAISQSGALITALAFGRAVIVTDVGGLPELVDGNGWVVPPLDSWSLATALRDAFSDLERLQRMGRRARESVAARYSASRVARQHIDLYQSLRGNERAE